MCAVMAQGRCRGLLLGVCSAQSQAAGAGLQRPAQPLPLLCSPSHLLIPHPTPPLPLLQPWAWASCGWPSPSGASPTGACSWSRAGWRTRRCAPPAASWPPTWSASETWRAEAGALSQPQAQGPRPRALPHPASRASRAAGRPCHPLPPVRRGAGGALSTPIHPSPCFRFSFPSISCSLLTDVHMRPAARDARRRCCCRHRRRGGRHHEGAASHTPAPAPAPRAASSFQQHLLPPLPAAPLPRGSAQHKRALPPPRAAPPPTALPAPLASARHSPSAPTKKRKRICSFCLCCAALWRRAPSASHGLRGHSLSNAGATAPRAAAPALVPSTRHQAPF